MDAEVDAAPEVDAGGTDAGSCVYVPTPGAIEFREMQGADATTMLEAAIAQAIQATPVFQPPAYPKGYGPIQTQAVVHVGFDPSAPEGVGTNALVLTSTVDFPSRLRLEIDSGVRLVWGSTAPGTLFDWNGVTDVTITRGNPCHGSGLGAGRFVVDLTPPNIGAKRFVSLRNVDQWLIEQVYTVSEFQYYSQSTGAGGVAAVTFNGSSESVSPRHGVYRHHANSGSGPSMGPNQIESLFDSYIDDLWTDGGAALRMEAGTTNAAAGTYTGVHRVTAEHIFAQNGSYVVSLTPHHAPSDDVHITDVRGVNMYLGIVLQKTNGTSSDVPLQVFTNTTIQDGCIVGGATAQDPSNQGAIVPSVAVLLDNQSTGSDISVQGIGYGGTFSGAAGTGGTDHSCTLADALSGTGGS